MHKRICKKCETIFYAKTAHVKMGFALFCSRACSYASMRSRKSVVCATCGKAIDRTASAVKRSKSQAYFCGKSCQTVWRNKQFSGNKHKNWKGGGSTYRDILLRQKIPLMCGGCGISDSRVLAAHHTDKNHHNNDPKNLQWLCHNCHHRIHHIRVSI